MKPPNPFWQRAKLAGSNAQCHFAQRGEVTMPETLVPERRFCRWASAVVMSTGFALAGVAVAMLAASPVLADEMESSYARGAKLYDKWYKVIGVDAPKASHPLYPSDKKYAKKPKSNWRCKECHGWDYMGKDGAYSSGKHSTGIMGVAGLRGGDPAKVVAVLKSADHGYGDKMDEEDMMDLANFITAGLIDMDKYIDAATKMPKGGDAARGAAYFNTVCASCHREDGTKPKDMGKSLGSQMGNPWEVMHKIVNGQPDEKMPALRAFGMQPVLDPMAYIATLPKKKL
jgi:thiosulfate dehydrogenase